MTAASRRRPWRSLILVGPILVVSGILLLTLTRVMYRSDTAFAQRAVTTTAVIVQVQPGIRYRDADGDDQQDRSRAVVTFSAHDQILRTTVGLDSGIHRVGDSLRIGYDPKDPGHAVAPPPTTAPEPGVYLLGGAGVLLVPCGVVIAVRGLYDRLIHRREPRQKPRRQQRNRR